MRGHPRWPSAAVAAALTLFSAASLDAQLPALVQNVPEIPIEVVEGFAKLPEGLYLAGRGRNGCPADDGWERQQTRVCGVVVQEAGFRE